MDNHELLKSLSFATAIQTVEVYGLVLVTLQGQIVTWNAGAEQLLGYSESEAVGQNFSFFFTPEDRAARVPQQEIAKAVSTGYAYDDRWHLCKNGTRTYVNGGLCLLKADDGQSLGFVKIIRSQTEKKRHLDEIEDLKTILATTDDFAYIFDPEGRFLYANAALLKVWAKTLDQVIGKTCHDLGYPTWHADMHMREIREIVQTRKPIRGEVPFTGDSGISGIYDYIFKPVLRDTGEVAIIVGTTRNITDRKRAEEKLAQAQRELSDRATHLDALVQERTQKLVESIGELESFSYSISHDLRAPLRAMMGFASVLREEYGPQLDAEANRYLERISSASQRMDELIKDVLSYSKVSRGELVLERIDPKRLISDIISTYPHLEPSEVTITVTPALPPVLANESALTQCIANLLGNAVKFVAEGIKPQVEISAETGGGFVLLLFRDNGIGIAPENLGSVFEIFKRVDHDHEGTGIGLSIVKKAVERMGGTVGLESELKRGSVFSLKLRAA
jgi:PAS domain S-box-containing protein